MATNRQNYSQLNYMTITEINEKLSLTTIMTVYIGSKGDEVEEAINSIFAQTLLPDQFIIYCDGPVTSEVNDVLSKVKFHPIVEVYHGAKNLGRGLARNHAILKAKHDLIAIMDSDDIARRDRFEKQIKHFATSEIDVLGGVIEEFRQVPGDYKRKRVCPIIHQDILALLPFRNPCNNVTIMFRQNIFKRVGGYKGLNFVEDWDFLARALESGAYIANVSDVLVDVRINKSRRYNFAYLREEVSNIKNICKLLRINCFIKIYSTTLRILRWILPDRFQNLLYMIFLRVK